MPWRVGSSGEKHRDMLHMENKENESLVDFRADLRHFRDRREGEELVFLSRKKQV